MLETVAGEIYNYVFIYFMAPQLTFFGRLKTYNRTHIK